MKTPDKRTRAFVFRATSVIIVARIFVFRATSVIIVARIFVFRATSVIIVPKSRTQSITYGASCVENGGCKTKIPGGTWGRFRGNDSVMRRGMSETDRGSSKTKTESSANLPRHGGEREQNSRPPNDNWGFL